MPIHPSIKSLLELQKCGISRVPVAVNRRVPLYTVTYGDVHFQVMKPSAGVIDEAPESTLEWQVCATVILRIRVQPEANTSSMPSVVSRCRKLHK